MAEGVSVYIALGSNLQDPVGQIRAALEDLRKLPQTRLECVSSLYRTAPIGLTAQPEFINAVCRAKSALLPQVLMDALLAIERAHARVRGAAKGGPRTLDLDLLLYGSERLQTDAVTLPHPRMHERAFVLVPLAELDSELEIPGHGKVRILAAACCDQRVERLMAA
ncbi:MAG: 2-amino-4-hydroxy-6-hydroxymethyldihydropteridine diphosphokinase [Pseudomonadota bacterium]|nr:MAG: 2-amino-4-hydroxy-6-hydroxymethyldihydropteridine diphosphokinase [Pseudomonadota bacterium]